MTVEEIFLAAVERAPAARVAYLDIACAADDTLRTQVEALLRSHEQAGSLLEQPLFRTGPVGDDPPTGDASGQGIEVYKLLELIGEGGMGSVWMAQQTEPVKRLVAVKLIKVGLDSKQVVTRFEAERQALALMDHPNIARVLDAGTTATGRPYFVMDLVKGAPITRYCDEHRLTTGERLGLFVQVCQAVQHAHQKGVIHRDIKPPNVLIACFDGRPVPKVIDFGVAKATGRPLTEKTLVTGFGAIVGTLEYMSPEQAEFNQLDVDTRSDIYSLGVLLYELLTGSPPFPSTGAGPGGLLETLRVIREQEPTRPSAKLSTAEGLPTLAANRGTEPAKLIRRVRGELDWIVMKALEKDRSRRYETANDFALDVQRYLADEPVHACPPSTVYRWEKFVRRNKGAVLAGVTIALLLLAGGVGTTFGLVRAERRAEGERRAKDTAEKRLAQIEKGIDVLGLVFDDLDPFAEEKEGRPLRAILGDRLDQAAAQLEGQAVGDALVVAKLQDRLGRTYLGLGHAAKAEVLFTKAVAARRAELGDDHPLTLASAHNQALACQAAGKFVEAITRFEQVRDARVKLLGADHPDSLATRHQLAASYWLAGRPAEAIPLLEGVRDERVRQLGGDHDHTLATLQDLAGVYVRVDRYTEAIALHQQVLDAQVRRHGEDHPHAIAALSHLAYACQRGYKMDRALALFEQARARAVPKLGPNHPRTLKILFGLAHMYRVKKQTAAAVALFEEVRERQGIVLGGDHPATILTLSMLALAYQDAGEMGKAMPAFEQAAAGVERLGYAHDDAERIFHNVASRHEQLGQYREAEGWRRKWVPVVKERNGPESLGYAGFRGLAGLGANLIQQKKYTDAEPVLRESLAVLQQKNPDGWDTSRARSLLGAALLGQAKYPEAEPHLVQGYRGMEKLEKSQGHTSSSSLDRQDVAEALAQLVRHYESTNQPDEAAKWRKELQARGKAAEPPVKPKPK